MVMHVQLRAQFAAWYGVMHDMSYVICLDCVLPHQFAGKDQDLMAPMVDGQCKDHGQ